MKTNRILAAALAGVTASTLAVGSPAQAAPRHVSRAADVWADFQTPTAQAGSPDTLHYYVMSPVVTSSMVGKVVTTTISSPAAIDCAGFGAGYSTSKTWVSVPFTVKTCNATSATITYKVTKQMVGSKVSVIGWTATSATSATIVGRFTLGHSVSTVSVTANRRAAEVPVGPLSSLGSWNGQPVSIASGGGVNEIWVGDKKYPAPQGPVVHADLTAGVVTVWTQGATSMDQWRLDLATGKVTTQSIPMVKLLSQGKPGFLVDTGEPVMYGTKQVLYRWDGTQVTTLGSYGSTVYGYTDTAFVYGGDYRVSWFTVVDTDGTVWGGATAPAPGSSIPITLIGPDRVEYTYPATSPTSGAQHCVLTKTTKTCTPA